MPDDPDQMLAGFQQQIEAKMQQAQRIQQAAENLRGEASSKDGSVSVTVDQSGNVVDLELTDGALRNRPAELSSIILSTVRSAQSKLSEQMRAAMTQVVGEDSGTLNAVLGGLRERFPQQDEQEQQPARRADSTAEDQPDEYDVDSWMDERRR